MPEINVSILIHGLFFMTQEGTNLRIYVPNLSSHHFIGGLRGARQELSGEQDLTGFGLLGKAPDPVNDVDGTIMQFASKDVGGFHALNDTDSQGRPLFRGSILLPWPLRFIGLRAGNIATSFRTDPASSIGNEIVTNARGKNSSTLGVVTLLQYTLPALQPAGGISQLNIHYYLQPCTDHTIAEVNDDLKTAKSCFKNSPGFDLLMLTPPFASELIPPSGHLEFGTTKEDEQSLDEERAGKASDIQFICRNDLHASPSLNSQGSETNVSPANCPVFFVGG